MFSVDVYNDVTPFIPCVGSNRNIGFIISSLYSLYLAALDKFMPVTNYVSVSANVVFLIARYYLLHGLLSLGWVAHLH